MGTNRPGRDAHIDRCPKCGGWRLNQICCPCIQSETSGPPNRKAVS